MCFYRIDPNTFQHHSEPPPSIIWMKSLRVQSNCGQSRKAAVYVLMFTAAFHDGRAADVAEADWQENTWRRGFAEKKKKKEKS